MSTQTFIGLLLSPEQLLADDNVRFSLKQSRIDSLADDILAQGGVMTPLDVEELAEAVGEATHRITDGHYRQAAVKKLNKNGADLMLPCIVSTSADAVARMRRQISSAVERESLTPMDTAAAIQKLLGAGVPKIDVRNIFARLGGRKGAKVQPASNSFVNMMLSFLDFPKDIQKKIHEGIIGVAGAYTLTKKPADKWAEIVAEIEAARLAEIEREEKDEEKFLAHEKKAHEARAAEEKLKKDLEAKKAELSAQAKLVDEFIHAEVEATKNARLETDAEKKKTAEEAVKAAKEKSLAVIKTAEGVKKEVAKMEEKISAAEKNAAERKAKLEEARKAALADAKGKGQKPSSKPAGSKEVEKASAKAGAANTVALNATQMRQAVQEWALPGSFPKVQQIFAIVKDVFAGGLTPNLAYARMAKVTGEKAEKAKAAKE